MRIYLVRHGRTFWNKVRRIQGSIDQPLDEEGIRQSHCLGSQLQEISFDGIYSSPQLRASETALILSQYLQKEVIFEPALRESSFGSAEGLTREEFYQLYADRISEAQAMPLAQRMRYRVIPDGESVADVFSRVFPFLSDLSTSWTGKTLIAVSHGGLIRSLLVSLFGIDDNDAFIENSGYVVLEHKNNKFSLDLSSH